MTELTTPSPPPSRAPPPPPVPIVNTSYKKAIDDLLLLTKPTSRIWGASFLAEGIKVLIHHNMEILSLSRSQVEPLSMDDLLRLSLIRSRLLSRELSVVRLDEIMERNVYPTLEEMEQCKMRRTVGQLDAILQLRERLVRDMGFRAPDLDECIEIIVQKMQDDAGEIITGLKSTDGPPDHQSFRTWQRRGESTENHRHRRINSGSLTQSMLRRSSGHGPRIRENGVFL